MSVEALAISRQVRGRFLVREVSLQVRPGEIVSILGVNGAGKSTLLRLLVGLAAPTQGRSRICGFDPFRERESAMRCVGYVPDEPEFWRRLSGRKCLEFVAALRGLSPADLARSSEALIERLDLGSRLDDRPETYSHGERKRLAILLALLHQPRALVLDEPGSGLDPVMSDRLEDLLREVRRRGVAVLMATHLVDQAERVSDRVVVVSRGRAVDLATEERAKHKNLREAFLSLVDDDGQSG